MNKQRPCHSSEWQEERNKMPDVVRSCESHPTTIGSGRGGWCRSHNVGKIGKVASLGSNSGSLTSCMVWREEAGFREHIATDGPLKGVSGRHAACGRAVVQSSTTTNKKSAGGVGSVENDQKSRAMGFLHGFCNLDWSLHHPH